MAYIGTSPSNGVRRRFVYEATASQTSFSGNDENGITLTYVDSLYLDVYQNGVKLKAGDDYTATTGTSVVLVQGASANDVVEMVAFDVFSVGDTVSASDGGNFAGNVAMAGTLGVTGATTVGGTLQVGVDGTTAGVIRFMDSGSVTEEATISSDANGGLIFGGNSGPGELIFKTNSGTEHMKINAIGAVTMPLQPAFSAYGDNQSYSSNTETIAQLPNEEFDINNDFNNTTDRFVAPVAGRYLFTGIIQYQHTGTAHIIFKKNGGALNGGYIDMRDAGGASQSRIFNLAANDYIQMGLYHGTAGATTGDRTRMTGFLIG